MNIKDIESLNADLREAFTQKNQVIISMASIKLFNGDQIKAKKLQNWISKVTDLCLKNSQLTSDISKLRMWQLSNLEITDIDQFGQPCFSFTKDGRKKITELEGNKLFNTLLFSRAKKSA